MACKTRHASGTKLAEILGPGEPMSKNEFPTVRTALRHGLYLQEMALLQEDRDRRNYPVPIMVKEIAAETVAVWQRANAKFTPPVIFAKTLIERKLQVSIIFIFPNIYLPKYSLFSQRLPGRHWRTTAGTEGI